MWENCHDYDPEAEAQLKQKPKPEPEPLDLAPLEALRAAASKTGFQIEGDDLRDAHIGQWLEAAHKTFPALSAELKALRARVGELEADRNEVAQKWLNKEAEVNELLPIKAERDQLREELAAKTKEWETDYGALERQTQRSEQLFEQLTAAQATIAGLREALHECVLFLDKIHRFKLIANYSPDYSELQTHRFAAADALTRTPEQHLGKLRERVLREAAAPLREDLEQMNPPEYKQRGKVEPGYCEALKDVIDRLEQLADEAGREG